MRKMTGQGFLADRNTSLLRRGLFSLVATAMAVLPFGAGTIAADQRPNILYCVADDWAWPHASAYGDRVVKTPAFDRVAREGVLFTHAFSAAPSCTPSRAAMLTGQMPHRLAEGGNLHGFLSSRFQIYPDLLEGAGYQVGFTRKGWGPGNFQAGGRARNPAGPNFKSFAEFLGTVPEGKPFCFWFGSQDPHRPYEKGSGLKSGLKLEDVKVPPFWPDTPEVRSDILDYYFEVQRFDREVGELLKLLESSGKLANTLVIITADNGSPFPRSKANLYDAGTRQPLAVRWPARFKGGRTIDDFISLTDLAPTLLEAAGLKPAREMTGRSFLGLLTGAEKPGRRDKVFVERERHAHVRKGNLSYPARAVRTKDYLYIRNFRPERWPAGDPELVFSVGSFGDCDNSPTKERILDRRNERGQEKFFRLCFGKRPAEELYDLRQDPHQMDNLAGRAGYEKPQRALRAELERWMKETGDPRATSDDDRWDNYPYFGAPASTPQAEKPPNFVIIFADDLGYADIGAYGARGYETPNLDRMAREGIRFTDFYVAQPVCSASRAALLTGCYPNRIGIHGALSPAVQHGIHDGEVTIAEVVKARGYATAIYGKWHLGHHAQFLPTRHGFDDYFGLPYSNDMWPHHPTAGSRFPPLPLIEGEKTIAHDPDQSQLTTWYTERAVRFIRQNKDRPFFLYVPHNMPHVPLFVSDKFKGKSTRGLYGDVIMEIDWSVGQILAALKEQGVDRNTLVMFISDNGPWLSYGTHAGSAHPLREGKGTSWEGGVRVPCIMRWPGRIPAASVSREPAMTIDLLPTIAELAGGQLPGHKIDGKNIWPLMAAQANARSPHEAFFFYYNRGELQALRSGRWKLYLPHSYRTLAGHHGGEGGKPADYSQQKVGLELYDLESDIGEKMNVAEKNPEVVKRLEALVEKSREDLGDALTQRKGKNVRLAGGLQ